MFLRHKIPILLAISGFMLAVTVGLPAAAQDATPGGAMPTPAMIPTVTAIPKPLPASTITQDRATLEVYFTTLAQGQTGLLHITGQGVAGARARFLDKLIDFFPMPDDGYYGFIAVSMEQNQRKYDLDIFVWYDDTTRQTINTQVEVDTGSFIRQDVTLAPDKSYLADPEIERNELAKLESVFSNVTSEPLWDDKGFQMPIPGGELTSPFGAFRTFNQILETRHTGWDIRATLGQPVMASAAGTVAYTGLMDIHGNIVIINHGYGVYSSYSHFSQVHVTRGQTISQGQVIGLVGNTGRTSGPHFHWEIAVNDTFVDAVQFMTMWKPG
jgi:murein DD-endopeptidase MepM/ murein hydrolase activator NlpD